MQDEKYANAKREIRSVLLTYPNGISLQEFLKSYKDLTCERLPTRILGFSSDLELLQSMPDAVYMTLNEWGKYHLFGIADSASAHIQKLVKKQRKPKTNNSSKKYKPSANKPTDFVQKHNGKVFVPGLLRAEMLYVMSRFPSGISLSAFVLAYKRLFQKALNLENGFETLEAILNAIPEFEVKLVYKEKRVYVKNEVSTNTKAQTSLNSKDISKEKESPIFDKSGLSESAQNNLKQLLKCTPEGIPAIYFPALYENVTGAKFNLHEFGYTSLFDLVDALPGIFTRSFDSSKNTWMIYPAGTKKRHFTPGKPVSEPEVPLKSQTHLKLKPPIASDIVPPRMQYKEPKFPENINLDEAQPIFVSAVVNPEHFWFQLFTNEVIEEFEAFEKKLGYFYDVNCNSNYGMRETDIGINSTCVVRCPEDNKWYRTTIKSIPTSEMVNVLFVDYGNRQNVPKTALRYLRKSFHDLPAQAFPAKLSNLVPVGNTWSVESRQCFIQFCENGLLMAILKHRDSMFSLYLCDTSDDQDIYINDVLIKEGYAKFAYESDFFIDPAEVGQGDFSEKHFNNQEIVSNGLKPSSSSPQIPLDAENKSLYRDEIILSKENSNSTAIAKSSTKRVDDCPVVNGSSEPIPNHCGIYVKRVSLCCDYTYHIINFKNEPYITSGDLSKLLWNDKEASYLSERLKYKGVATPSIEIFKNDLPEIFQELERHKVPDLNPTSFNISSVILYALKRSLNVLNIFGHPSVCVRLSIENEITKFNPSAWKDYTNGFDLLESDPMREKIEKLCLYDLKTKYEALELKKLKLKQFSETGTDELSKIENLQKQFKKRIRYIENLCLEYSN